MNAPSISVITVTFNACGQLPGLIESLRAQTDQNFEWALVDGASTDGTVELIKSAGDVVSHWISEPDCGIYDATLALFYNASDVTVEPSRQEAFGQTSSEAQACGTPVVAFDHTGLPDVVVHRETGYLARALDAMDLAAGIQWVLEDVARRAELGRAARMRALQLLAPEVVVPQYLQVYAEAMDRQGTSR